MINKASVIALLVVTMFGIVAMNITGDIGLGKSTLVVIPFAALLFSIVDTRGYN